MACRSQAFCWILYFFLTTPPNTFNMSSILSHAPSTILTFHTCISPYVTEYRYPSNPDMTWLKPAFAEVRHCLVLQGSILALSGANCCLKFAPSNPQVLVNVSSYVNFQLYPFFQPTHTLATAAAAAKYKAGALAWRVLDHSRGCCILWCQHR